MNDSQKFQLLNIFSTIISKVENEHVLECVSKVLLKAFLNKMLNAPKDLMVKNLSQTICGKIMFLNNHNIQIKQSTIILIEYLSESNNLEVIYEDYFSELFTKLKAKFKWIGYDEKVHISEFDKQMSQKLKELGIDNTNSNLDNEIRDEIIKKLPYINITFDDCITSN